MTPKGQHEAIEQNLGLGGVNFGSRLR